MLQLNSKRRRTAKEKAADDLMQKQSSEVVQNKLAQIAQLEEDLKIARQAAQENLSAAKLMSDLQHQNVIHVDEFNNVTLV